MRKGGFLPGCIMFCLALMTLTGCATAIKGYDSYYLHSHNRAKYNYEVGTANVAVLSVTPWDDVVGTLKPNFDMDAKTALAESIPTTMRYEQRMIETMLARLGVALPSTSITSSSTTTESSATGTSSTSASTREKKPGDVGASKPDTSQSSLEPPAISGKSAMEGDIGLDPMVKYTAANALFQEVKLLNRYVSDAALHKDAKAYIVRLQASVMPHKRNMPYDTYMNITFNNSYAKVPKNSPTIIPLLVTDDLEALASSRSAETVLQLGMALSGMVNGIGAQGDLEKSLKNMENFRGQSMNSLMTIARVTDNTLRVRLGAMQQGNSLYAVVPRTHNISVLLFVPNKFAKEPNDTERRLNVSTLTRFRDTVSGIELPDSPTFTAYTNSIRNVLKNFEFEDSESNINLAKNMINHLSELELQKSRKDFSKLTQKPDAKSEIKNKGCEEPRDTENCDVMELIDFSNYLNDITVHSVIQDALVYLPKVYDVFIPKQTVLASDDNKEITVLVNRANGVDVKSIESAELKIGNISLEPTAIVLTETNGIKFTYSSLSKLKLDKKYDGTQCDDSSAELALRVKLPESEKEDPVTGDSKHEDKCVGLGTGGHRYMTGVTVSEPSQDGKQEKEPATSATALKSDKKVSYMQCADTNGQVNFNFAVCYVKTDPLKGD